MTKKTTRSGIEIKPLYTAADLAPDLDARLGAPGEYPFARGIYPTMYRGKLWTMRQYAGFGTPRETNERFRYLLAEGQTGLSVALDLPTQLGYDSDAPDAAGEVGRVGVAIDSLADMEEIFAGIPLDQVTTSFTINATAPILLAMYQATAEKQGVAPERIAGTVQNDLLKEFGSRGAWVFPIDPSLRLCVDVIQYCTDKLPRFNPISIASHYRDAGANPVEEAAYTLSAGVAYARACVDRGLAVDAFAPRLSFFWYTYTNFFEEIAKYRAARRIWAATMRDRFGADRADSQRLRSACVCGGHSLTKQEPLNNIARTTIETMAVALGGLQSVFTAAYDEAYAIPTELAAKTALRVQQIVAYETDVAATVDPLAGSYFVEALTDEMERAIRGVMDEIDRRGGMVECLRSGWVQRKIGERAYEWQRKLESGEVVIPGVNRFASPEENQHDVEVHRVPLELERAQVERVRKVRAERDAARTAAALERLSAAARSTDNLMPPVVEAVRAYATVGEITGVLRRVFGTYVPPVF
ncbi:MAG TPA: methylmalonyl-CoA mutase family protein [Haliangiales bacterium]|nr:methylmalonyl-CoA mutase family protein [Haliangiales bacterium]